MSIFDDISKSLKSFVARRVPGTPERKEAVSRIDPTSPLGGVNRFVDTAFKTATAPFVGFASNLRDAATGGFTAKAFTDETDRLFRESSALRQQSKSPNITKQAKIELLNQADVISRRSAELGRGQVQEFTKIQGRSSPLQVLGNTLGVMASIKGGPTLATAKGLTGVGLSGLLGGIIAKATGGDVATGAGRGVGIAPTTFGISSVTNPIIGKTANKFFPGVDSFKTRLINRGAVGLLNVPEGFLIDRALQQDSDLTSILIDFTTGAVLGSGVDIKGKNNVSINEEGITKRVKEAVETQALSNPKTAKQRLDLLVNYPEYLRQQGYDMQQINNISVNEARQIIDFGIPPTQHKSFIDTARAKKLGVEDFNELKPFDVKNKVNLVDYARTPDRVFKKIGLEPEFNKLRKGHEAYLRELPVKLDKVTEWSNEVSHDPESSRKIFQFLDGKNVQLDTQQLKVATEMKAEFAVLAKRMKLPADKTIKNYVTHLYEPDFIKKEFDPELAKLITNRVPGSVYNPFLEKRLVKAGFIEDAFLAMEVYQKRAIRKIHMDPSLAVLQKRSENLDLESLKFVEKFGARINLRPTDMDNLLDNAIKSSPFGYKFGQRPTARGSRKLRGLVYKGALGLNFGSAVRNLSQGANTFAELGGKYTAVGYQQFFRRGGIANDELLRSGIYNDSFIQDRGLSTVKKGLAKLDKGLFFFFDKAEKLNRGTAYWGAKQKALDAGKTPIEASDIAKEAVRKTQFAFSAIDTPLVLSSDISKTLLQFQSFNIKQLEFIAEKLSDKDVGGIARYMGSTFLLSKILSNFFRMDWKDSLLPTVQVGNAPPFQVVEGGFNILTGDEDAREQGIRDLQRAGLTFIPAGIQIKKTVQGLSGEDKTVGGNVRFKIEDTPSEKLRGLVFGPKGTKAGREYFDFLDENRKMTRQKKEYQKVMTKALLSGDTDTVRIMFQDGVRFGLSLEDSVKESIRQADNREEFQTLLPYVKAFNITLDEIKTARNKRFSTNFKAKAKRDMAKAIIDKDKEKFMELLPLAKQFGWELEDILKEVQRIR